MKNHTLIPRYRWGYIKISLGYQNINIDEIYIIPYNNDACTIFRMIKDEEFIRNKVKETFGDKLVSLKAKSFFDDYYIKENDVYTYIFYMLFANFYLMNYINFQATSNLMEGTKAKVVCLDNCVEFVRKYLDETVEITCICVD